jgi:REP element-mobilizing transposase RayT
MPASPQARLSSKNAGGQAGLLHQGWTMAKHEIKITRRHLPHWSLDGAMYYVTFRPASGELRSSERALVLNHIKEGDGEYYTLVGCVVMPDHAHVILMADLGYSLEKIMKGVKGASARKLNIARGSRGKIWQHESFDRIVRCEKELHGKLVYMLNNPLKAGLVEDPWRYRGWYCNKDYFRR